MFGFLHLLLVVLFWGVVESEGVESSFSLSPAVVTGSVRGSQRADSLDAEQIDKSHKGDDLPDTFVLDLTDSSDGVGGDSLKTGKAGESGEDESEDGHLGNTSVDEFNLTVPFKSGKVGVSKEGKSVKVVSHQVSLGGKEAWVETNISRKTSVKGGRGLFERKGGGRDGSRAHL